MFFFFRELGHRGLLSLSQGEQHTGSVVIVIAVVTVIRNCNSWKGFGGKLAAGKRGRKGGR